MPVPVPVPVPVPGKNQPEPLFWARLAAEAHSPLVPRDPKPTPPRRRKKKVVKKVRRRRPNARRQQIDPAVVDRSVERVRETLQSTSAVMQRVRGAPAWSALGRGASAVTGFVSRAAAWALAAAWDRRDLFARFGHRALWWASLALAFWFGRVWIAGTGDPDLLAWAPTAFAAGLGMAALVLLLAPERRMRVASFALGAAHGCAAIICAVVAA